MIPGVNPRQLKQMMKQMGMSQDDLSVTELIMKTADGKTLVFQNPEVQKITMQGNTSFQVSGSYTEQVESAKITISDEDIEMVSSQAGVSKEEARKALDEVEGDIAQAIVNLS